MHGSVNSRDGDGFSHLGLMRTAMDGIAQIVHK